MPLTLPVLDDRTYAALVREGIERIPRYAPAWTNHNASDPGITLIELFAYLTEIQVYRVSRVSDASRAKFLALLLGGGDAPPDSAEHLDRLLDRAVTELRRPHRAVSASDFEYLALEAIVGESSVARVERVYCVPRRNLQASTGDERRRDRPGHISLVFVPQDPWLPDDRVSAIGTTIVQYLEPRRLLTTRLHVVPPRYLDLRVRVQAVASAGHRPADVEHAIRTAIAQVFDPQAGGPGGSGPESGRRVYASDLARRLTPIEGVSHVEAFALEPADGDRGPSHGEGGTFDRIEMQIGEMMRVREVQVDLGGPAGR